ncbi:LOW QUALITY PROTEIN: murinoglobulin-1-like [Haliotis rubra]|uniref:LOW QUALITY PROTEIN: murinoglobulin-1-like n=1 Tax=Haliotis rubra TaxID=36100 RepID=UPI001EE607CB|nr:LOW QUALITY PROTEIN: murinoglobulin-1-like [Haliotis rubra]
MHGHLLLGAVLLSLASFGAGQLENNCLIENTQGCRLERPPIYMILAPKRVRPNQVIQMFTTILKLEYTHVNVRISIVKENIEYTGTVMKFERPSSRIMQLQMPQNAQAGQYRLRVEGTLNGGTSGYIFRNETDIEFDTKQASLFIQMSKPIYRQGQMVQFRVIPILPDMMPKYGSMTIYVEDPTGIPVRRWLGLQTNAGGLVSQSFELADQPNYGNWSIRVDAFGHTYRKRFVVEEFWEPRFDVNVSVPPYIMDNIQIFQGVVLANQTSGRPVIGNASITLMFKPKPVPGIDYGNNFPYIYRFIEYHLGRIDFKFTIEEIRQLADRIIPGQNLVDCELVMSVNVSDWHSGLNRTGVASTIIFNSNVKLKWVGGPVRTFKPNSIITVAVAVMKYDGTPVDTPNKIVRLYSSMSNSGPAQLRYDQPVDKSPVGGIVEFEVYADTEVKGMMLEAEYDNDPTTRIQLRGTRFFSQSQSYITVTTSTDNPKVNEYMIFHVRTSNFVPRIFYQVVSGGNIIIGDELEMTSRQKTFAIALSREMIPTARMVVYYLKQPEEIVVDVLNFFVNGTRQNQVTLEINRGKDFSRDTIEFNAWADPGSYVAFAGMPVDLYNRGMDDGISEKNLIDELGTYDQPANGSYRHLWRISDTEYEYKFFHASDYGIDTNTTFKTSGLLILTDADVGRLNNVQSCEEQGQFPCYAVDSCYTREQICDKVFTCPDGADEQGCIYEDTQVRHASAMDRVSRIMRFYDNSSWAWQEIFVKPDGRVDFRVDVPKYPLSWVINGLSVSRELGLGIMQRPVLYDAARYMYIQVEAPETIVRGEQIGVRVTVFNYWYNDDYIEVLVTMHGGPDYEFVVVNDMGIVSAYKPTTHKGDHQTIVFLEPGESKDIYMPIVPTIIKGEFTFRVSASCFMERDEVYRKVNVQPDGVRNYYHTPYLIDLITYASIIIPDLDVPVPEQFVVPEQREHLYVPGSAVAHLSIFGDVVTPGFFEDYLNAENVLWRPYGTGENIAFNFAYNLLTLRFMKASQQLSEEALQKALYYMNIVLQRQMGYMNDDGSFRMFRDDPTPSLWLTAFVAKSLHQGRFGEWERDLFIPLELINKMVVWICRQQNETGAFHPDYSVAYDRKMASGDNILSQRLYDDPISLTAYVLIALYETTDVSEDALACLDSSRARAANYLANKVNSIPSTATFQLSITAYALSLSQEKSRTAFDKLWDTRRTSTDTYFSDAEVPSNPSEIVNTVRFLKPRQELRNDAHATQATAYALMAHINNNGVKFERDSMMRWLQTMRNSIGGFTSTQDTLVAMEALFQFTQVDPNRNVFDMMVKLESTASPNWSQTGFFTKANYTKLQNAYLPLVYGAMKILAQGTGRALMQLTTTVNVEYPWLLKPTQDEQKFFDLMIDYYTFTGRNGSIFEMSPCVSWAYTEKSLTSGLAVLEIDIPTGYMVMNNTLREYVQSGIVPNLRRAEFYGRKVVYYFEYLDQSKTCVYFRADRWYPVANATIQHRIRVFDYYEPGMHNTSIYTTYTLFTMNICFACGSYQCPYCPSFNVAAILQASISMTAVMLGFIIKRHLIT